MSQALDTLWYTRCPVPTGLGIAVQKGWLQDAVGALGTGVQSLRESSDKAVRESHFDHTLRNSVRHGGSIPAIWARAQGRETRVIGLSWADESQLILTRPDSGIHSVKDLKGRTFGLPDWAGAQIDFTRAQALRGLENALKLEGLQVGDLQLVNFRYGGTFSDGQVQTVNGTPVSQQRVEGRNLELIGLLRGEVDAIFLKGASAAQYAHDFGLRTVIDTGAHPDPLIRSNNGTPRTLAVDLHLLEQHFDVASGILDSVLRADHTLVLPQRPTTVSVLTSDGRRCTLPHQSGAQARDYLRACGREHARLVDRLWLVQADGRVSDFGVAPWNAQTQENSFPYDQRGRFTVRNTQSICDLCMGHACMPSSRNQR